MQTHLDLKTFSFNPHTFAFMVLSSYLNCFINFSISCIHTALGKCLYVDYCFTSKPQWNLSLTILLSDLFGPELKSIWNSFHFSFVNNLIYGTFASYLNQYPIHFPTTRTTLFSQSPSSECLYFHIVKLFSHTFSAPWVWLCLTNSFGSYHNPFLPNTHFFPCIVP